MKVRSSLLSLLVLSPATALAQSLALAPPPLEEIVVWGGQQSSSTSVTNPVSLITPEDLLSVNVTTTEDLVKYEPSLVIRRRFIGDANGTLGIRGSNMFQTPRSMVFADGVPLHYFLQSRWSGAPRWTLVSASEIAQVEVIYGPFSAEYSGNAMGGVVVIETAIPQEREFHFDSSFFAQQFDAYGFDETLTGYKSFLSVGDKIGDLSLYFSYNRLESESQPETFHYGGAAPAGTVTGTIGAIPDRNELGRPVFVVGDSGVIDTTTDNFKFKAGYDFGKWSALLNIAYEDRQARSDSPNSYLHDANGRALFSGNFVQDGIGFSLEPARLNVSESDRYSLSTGLRLRGELREGITVEANLNRFEVLHDEARSARANPADPLYSPAGEISDFDDTGWETAELKLTVDDLGSENLSLLAGLRQESYRLNMAVYDSNNYRAGSKTNLNNSSGGETEIAAFFAQLHWTPNAAWDVTLGGRFERWQSQQGYYYSAATESEFLPSRSADEFSPKFSLGYRPADDWLIRYSAARAYRFPIVEELFNQYREYNAVSQANPSLEAEAGLHQNLMFQRSTAGVDWQINLFSERVENVIVAQSTTFPGGASISTFIPVDTVDTQGIEFVAKLYEALPATDLRFNLSYTDATIVSNRIDPSIEGNSYPRMPEWRANLVATHHLSDRWTLGGTLQYASDSYGRLDNADEEEEVFGAQDGYLRLGLKANFAVNEQTRLALGVDNLNDNRAFVAHPWPGRTFYLNMSYDY